MKILAFVSCKSDTEQVKLKDSVICKKDFSRKLLHLSAMGTYFVNSCSQCLFQS
uniref:Uncharacterized protein n=1 Tax=Arundo donax TaxID=35708 RepID=A0A0A9H7M6_ARUDO